MTSQEDMRVEVLKGRCHVVLPSSVAFYNPQIVEDVVNRLDEELAGDAVKALVLDLSEIDQCGTQLLTLLLRAHIRAKRHEKELRLCEVRPFVCDVIRTMALDQIFRDFGGREQAMEA